LTCAYFSGVFNMIRLCVIAVFLAVPLHAQDKPVSARLKPFVDNADVSGFVTVVGNKEGIVSLDVMGKQNLEKDLPMKENSLFRIASMTKPITAMGIMLLAEEGKLSIDDPVEKHLPEFKGQMMVASKDKDTVTLKKPARPITIKDLLTHTSGMPAPPVGIADLYQKRTHTLAEGVMAFSQRPLDFEPGSKWAYCNPGIDTLGRIIEIVSGQPYEAFLKARIFEPLGMTDTTFFPGEAQLQRLAITYDKKDGKLLMPPNTIIGPPKDAKYPIPAGGLYSTGPDLAKLYAALLSGGISSGGKKVISPASLKQMTTVQTGDLKSGFTPGMGWGLGFGVVVTSEGSTESLSPGSFGHGGAFGTQAWIDPVKGKFYVLLIQRVGMGNSDGSKIRQEFQAAAQ